MKGLLSMEFSVKIIKREFIYILIIKSFIADEGHIVKVLHWVLYWVL